MRIINRLKTLRTLSGKTQEQVVEEITAREGRRVFTRQMLSHWEKGRYQPANDDLAVLCAYYGVTPGEILVLEGSPEAVAA